MSADDEGLDFFAGVDRRALVRGSLEVRESYEKKAKMTPGERDRRAVKTAQLNIRTTVEKKELVGLLAETQGISLVTAVENAIDFHARHLKVRLS